MQNIKKTSIFLFILLIICFVPTFISADELTQRQKQLQKIYAKLKQQRINWWHAKKKEASALSRLYVVKSQLNDTRQELNQARNNLNSSENQVAVLNKELARAQSKLEIESKQLASRLREVYKSRGFDYMELIFSSNSLSDFINRSYYFEKILNYDIELVQRIRKEHNYIQQKRNEKQQVANNIRNLTKLIGEKETVVRSKVAERGQIFGELKQRRMEYEKQIAQLRQASAQVEYMVRKILNDQKGTVVPKSTGILNWPLRGKLTSYFGYRRHPLWGSSDFHTGLDIAAAYGSPIASADGGTVIFAGWWNGYGKCIIINHGKGISTLYGHLSRIYVQKKQSVAKGQVVGAEGSTGYSTGPHLHFEVRVNGKPTNPLKWLK